VTFFGVGILDWLLKTLSSVPDPIKVELILALDNKPPFRKGASALDNVPDALVLKSSPSELSESSKSDRFAGFVSLSTTRLASFLSSFNGDGNGEVTTGLTTTVVVSLGS
jgi:hypothetical protein